MLTPKFELQQNEDVVFVYIQVPYAKVSEIEVNFEDYVFLFYCKPYLLRLNLPGKVIFCENPDIQYDLNKKTITVKVPKAVPGERFEGLDLLTSLYYTKNNCKKTPLIEVIGEAGGETTEDFNLSDEKTPCELESDPIAVINQQCGFANLYSLSVFSLKEETTEIFDIRDPQIKTINERKEERLKLEELKFSKDHCLADLYDSEEIKMFLSYQTEWQQMYELLLDSNWSESPDDKINFSEEEKEQLRKLPNKEYLLDKFQVKSLLLGIIDIIFAYVYDIRTTLGEDTVESSWTVNKLSATLSWLEVFSSVPDVALSCIRRSLCFPLHRHFGLAIQVLDDVRQILLLGKKYVLKCLLSIHKMFLTSDPRYILNDLYITDYCIWIQSRKVSSNMFIKLGIALEKVLSKENYSGLHLKEFEYYAYIAWLDFTEEHNPWEKHCSAVSFGLNPDEAENVIETTHSKTSVKTSSDELSDSTSFSSNLSGSICEVENEQIDFHSVNYSSTSDSSYSESSSEVELYYENSEKLCKEKRKKLPCRKKRFCRGPETTFELKKTSNKSDVQETFCQKSNLSKSISEVEDKKNDLHSGNLSASVSSYSGSSSEVELYYENGEKLQEKRNKLPCRKKPSGLKKNCNKSDVQETFCQKFKQLEISKNVKSDIENPLAQHCSGFSNETIPTDSKHLIETTFHDKNSLVKICTPKNSDLSDAASSETNSNYSERSSELEQKIGF